VGEGRGGK
jgi:hypothetical protein